MDHFHFLPSTQRGFQMTMSEKIEAAKRALRTVDRLHESFHAPILAALAEYDVIPNGGEMRAASAKGLSRIAKVAAESEANPSVKAALTFALGQLRQCGSSLDDILNDAGTDVSLSKLNAVMAPKSPEWRISARTALHRAGLID
jgi:hypothetical protein